MPPRAPLGAFLLVCIATCALPSAAQAQLTLPHGQVVPIDSGGEKQIYELFNERGEAIDWINDASVAPSTFSPLCGFSAELVLKESGSSLGVGWYNVVPGATQPPSALEIYEILPAGSQAGATVTGATIRDHPGYLGGAVGFALLRIPPHFTEPQWNIYCDQGSCAGTPGNWVLSLSYRSTQIEAAYYVAFEDGDTTNSGWNNDGDYNDYVFLFTGIACEGAGEPCTVEAAQGVCRAGLTECDAVGELVCKPSNAPQAEVCDGVDNDCDGSVDMGDAVCPEFQHCVAGNCVPTCGNEFPCFGDDVCEAGLCVHVDCVGVTCDEGKACRQGNCLAPCDGVVCPGDQVCRVGRCVDPCEAVDCGPERVCSGGVCVQPCECGGCPAGLSCDAAGMRCVDPGCEMSSCAAAEVCRVGGCVDACQGATCPVGQRCSAGACIDGAAAPDAGLVPGTGGVSGTGGAPLTSDPNNFGGGMASGGATRPTGRGMDTEASCGCRLPGAPGGGTGGAWLLLALPALRRRRRT